MDFLQKEREKVVDLARQLVSADTSKDLPQGIYDEIISLRLSLIEFLSSSPNGDFCFARALNIQLNCLDELLRGVLNKRLYEEVHRKVRKK